MVRAIGNSNSPATRSQNDFTPSSATKMLPLVRQIASEMLVLTRAIEAQREQLRGIDQLPETIDHDNYREEVSDIRGSLANDEQRLHDCRRELSSLGLEVHDPFDGAVDFPTILNRRRVQLCWTPEDERVEFWHEVGQSCRDRKRIGSQEFGAGSRN